MDSKYFRAAELVSLFMQKKISEAELQELKDMVADNPKIAEWLEDSGVKMEVIKGRLEYYNSLDEKAEWNSILSKLHQKKNKKLVEKRWLAIAASILLIALVGALLYKPEVKQHNNLVVYKDSTEILPGKEKAVLTLSDGRKVNLDQNFSEDIQDGNTSLQVRNNHLDYSTSSSESVNMHKLEIPSGGTYHIQLADGTKVWLNANSELEYPSAFVGKERIVSMKGEAYFEVAKSKNKPFKVQVDGMEIEALGTAFNVNTHLSAQKVKAILTEGRIRVTEKNNSKTIDAGHEIVSNKGTLMVSKADIEEAVAWKEGYFYFNKKSMNDILGEISRWYDIDVSLKTQLSNEHYQGGVKRSESIEKVCAVLSDLSGYRFSVENKKLVVSK